MKIQHLVSAIILTLIPVHQACAKGKAWTDPKTATKENPDFLIQGEYGKEGGLGIQVVAVGNSKFQAAVYKGGLPGAGANNNEFKLFTGETKDGKTILEGPANQTITIASGKATGKDYSYDKVNRKSPTLGQKPPKGAIILFDGRTNGFNPGKTRGEYLAEGQITKDKFKDFQLHIEFRTPFKPDSRPGSQDRGNSGIYIFNNYHSSCPRMNHTKIIV